ncbi:MULTISPECIES: hypothetical protein [unclassified Nocardioides]|uniref:hypothetical protein n=1 Tax=unclassified Nocardioides TaxID=2615069 RepID=UPI00360F9A48
MTDKPAYAVHHVDEKDVTVDWFFGRGHVATTVVQALLVLVGWFFAILPLVILTSALLHRDDPDGWWNYEEGFVMFDRTMIFLGILLVGFVVGFLVLFLVNRRVSRRREREKSYDEERLALRLGLAADLYASKYGAEQLRLEKRSIRIEPYSDFETFELRDTYRLYGVDR